jgi:transcriptional regulator NrdR family protein
VGADCEVKDMRCPKCDADKKWIKVIDSRPAEQGTQIRRRRECKKCKARFTTYEHTHVVEVADDEIVIYAA